MPKIKTREQVKDIKVLDKAAIVGQRMKNAALRAKAQVTKIGDERQESLGECAQETAEAIRQRAARTVAVGGKVAARKGKKLIPSKEEILLPVEPDVSWIMDAPVPPPQASAAGNAVERGRTLAKQQTVKRMTNQRQMEHSISMPTIKTKEATTAGESISLSPAKKRRRTPKAMRRRTKAAPKGREQAVTPMPVARAAQQAARRTFMAEQQTVMTAQSRTKKAKKGAKAAGAAVKRAACAAAAAARSLTAALAAGGGTVLLVLVMILLPGLLLGSCFGIFFSGHSYNHGSQTMPEVVRGINQEFEDRIEALQNETPHDDVEISASQARWPEVLAVYAVKTTNDPDNPQEVATVTSEKKALLKEIFWTIHEVSSYTTTSSHTVTSTVPTEGGGTEQVTDTVTTTTLHIVITHRSVDEMANEYGFSTDQRQQLHELLSEENRRLWTALLSGLGDGDGEIVAVALSQLGNRGGEPYWSWYGFTNCVNWCACFVSWCADQCGYLEADAFPKFSYCPAGIQWFQDAGLWQDRTFEPRPGDIIFYDWEGDGVSDHVGIVEKVENGWIYTIEGNCDDACKQLAYPLGDSCICGFGTPETES
ncbi:MAG: CHAP domain-containing protein [Oscillospiraceae bacterium]|nr:CHAP domain-containing protein [Oscillospiraceae bacterium]